MNFKRSERVSELLRHEISSYVQHINDPRLGFVTVTGVRLSDDLTDAKVFYSVLGTDEEKESSARILKSAIFNLRHDMGKKLESLRRIPSIQFIYDDTVEKAQRGGTLLEQITKERSDGDQGPGFDERPKKPYIKKSRKK